MGIISIKNLVHRFSKYGDNGEEIGEKTALEQVSLDIEKGSFVAILGHNGSGSAQRQGAGPPVPTTAHTINFFSEKHTTVIRTLQNSF